MTRLPHLLLPVIVSAAIIGLSPITVSAQREHPSHDGNMASISGIIKYTGRVPKPVFQGFSPSEPVDDPAARGLINAFVYLEKLDESHEPIPGDPKAGESLEPVHMDQIGFRFVPQVQVVQVGQDLIFGNSDFQNHNVRGNTEVPKNLFNVIMKPQRKVTKHFDFQGNTSPIKITCDFHPSMEAWVYVIDHPRYAVTTQDGKFEIGPMAPGRYRLHVTQPIQRVRAEIELELTPGDRVQARVTFGIPHKYYRSSPPIKIDRDVP